MSDEQRIRDRAYEIWEAKDRPEGQEAEHWAQARDEVEFYKEGDATAGSVESSVAIPMPATGPMPTRSRTATTDTASRRASTRGAGATWQPCPTTFRSRCCSRAIPIAGS